MKQLLKYPLIIIFFAFIAITTIVDFIVPSKPHSYWENRDLAQKPKMTLTSLIENKYTSEYEKFINDQFAARDTWISIKSVAESALGKIENNGVVYGKDNYMFDKLNTPDLERIDKNIGFYRDFVEKYPDEKITVGIIPNSYSVLTDKAPTYLNNIDQTQYTEKLFSQLEGENLSELYFSDALKAHQDEYIYYRTDHHWTTLGAYYAYAEYVRSLGFEPVKIESLQPKIQENFLGTYFNKSKSFNAKPDFITWYDIPTEEITVNLEAVDSMYDISKFNERDMYAAFLRGNNGQTIIKSSVNQNKVVGKTSKILVIKDSYANSFVPFLLYNFDEVHVVDLRKFAPKLSLYLSENDFDEILLMYNFKNFSEDINIPKLRY
ncbi:MAG: DHHW family protein [Oscillospiraceae bacterium]